MNLISGTHSKDSDNAGQTAERIANEFIAELKNATENYDTSKVTVSLRTPPKGKEYYVIELFNQPFINFKGTTKLFMEVSPRISSLFSTAHVTLDSSRSNGWARILASDFSFSGFTALVTEIYEAYLCSNEFDCCSHFLECSDARHCVHSNLMFAGQCTYRQKLRKGQIFFGNNRNIN